MSIQMREDGLMAASLQRSHADSAAWGGTSYRSSAHDLSSLVVVVVYARSELSISDDRISRTVNLKSLVNARDHASPHPATSAYTRTIL